MQYDRRDADMRFKGTIVRFKGEAVHVDEVTPDLVLRYTKLIDGTGGEAKLTDEDWDFTPVPTGYVNRSRAAFWVHRMPKRMWKQGLHAESVIVCEASGDRVAHGLGGIIKTPDFDRCVQRYYPSYQEALDDVRQGRAFSRAFSAEFALCRVDSNVAKLASRGKDVGWVMGDLDEPLLSEQWRFLSEELRERIAI